MDDKQIEEFKEIYKKEHGKELSDASGFNTPVVEYTKNQFLEILKVCEVAYSTMLSNKNKVIGQHERV